MLEGGEERRDLGQGGKLGDLRVISANTLQICRLIGRDFLRRGALFVEDVVDADADGDGIPNMRNQIRARDSQGEGRVVDVVDKVVHLGGFDVHEAVDFGLGRGAGVGGERGGGAAEDEAEVGVEGCEEPRWVLDGRGREGVGRGGTDLYWFEDLSQAGTPDSRAVTPPPSRKFREAAFWGRD